MAKRLVFFNHKGGVSKTTSAYNIGWMLSKEMKILLVDADPQCNLTSLILGDNFEQYYTEAHTSTQNIKDGVAPAFSGSPNPIQAIRCVSPQRSSNLFLMPGHANLSEYDAALTFAQTSNGALSTLQNLPGAFSRLIALTEEAYGIDLTIIDLNPGLSAINQNLFLSSDSFILPTNPDPFSLMALDTLKTVLPRWIAWKNASIPIFATSAYPLHAGTPKFFGTLIQRFNIRKGRAARPYRDNIEEINNKVVQSLIPALSLSAATLSMAEYGSELINNKFCLGQIPDFQGLLPKSYVLGVPVFEIANDEFDETGPVLEGFIEKRNLFRGQFEDIGAQISGLLQYA